MRAPISAGGGLACLALLALAALGWWARGPATPPRVTRAVLLTPGWRELPPPGVPVFQLPGAAAGNGAQRVPDVGTVLRLAPGLRELEIRGDGVEWAGARSLREVRVTWPDAGALPSQPEIAAVEFTRELTVGQPFRVNGRVVGLGAGASVTVTLEEPDGRLRRVDVRAGSEGAARFAVTGEPTRTAGRFLWRLRVGDGGSGSKLGAVVLEPQRPRVLLVQEAPTWEVARLHEWLERSGSGAVLRTRVSAERWRLVGGSAAKRESAALTPAWLAEFEVLVATEAALRNLAADERAALAKALRDDGLGLLVVGEPDSGQAALPWGLGRITLESTEPESMVRTTRLRLASGREAAEPVAVWAATWDERPLQRALARDSQGRIVAALEPWGRGWIARSLVVDSWRWPLAGHASDYAAWWTELIGAVARSQAVAGAWRRGDTEPLVSVGQPLDLIWAGEAGREPAVARVRADGATDVSNVGMAPVANRPGEAWTRAWPTRAGWNRIECDGAAGLDLWVAASGEWPGVERARRREVMATLVQAKAAARIERDLAADETDSPGWRWLAWAVLVGAMGALWWRERRVM